MKKKRKTTFWIAILSPFYILLCCFCFIFSIYESGQNPNTAKNTDKSEISEEIVREKIEEFQKRCSDETYEYIYEYFPKDTPTIGLLLDGEANFSVDVSYKKDTEVVGTYIFGYPGSSEKDNNFYIINYKEKLKDEDNFSDVDCPFDIKK